MCAASFIIEAIHHNLEFSAKEDADEAAAEDDSGVSRPVSVQDMDKQSLEKQGAEDEPASGVKRERTDISRVSKGNGSKINIFRARTYL